MGAALIQTPASLTRAKRVSLRLVGEGRQEAECRSLLLAFGIAADLLAIYCAAPLSPWPWG